MCNKRAPFCEKKDVRAPTKFQQNKHTPASLKRTGYYLRGVNKWRDSEHTNLHMYRDTVDLTKEATWSWSSGGADKWMMYISGSLRKSLETSGASCGR